MSLFYHSPPPPPFFFFIKNRTFRKFGSNEGKSRLKNFYPERDYIYCRHFIFIALRRCKTMSKASRATNFVITHEAVSPSNEIGWNRMDRGGEEETSNSKDTFYDGNKYYLVASLWFNRPSHVESQNLRNDRNRNLYIEIK